MEIKRKTPLQLEALDTFYSENNYPLQEDMENFAATLGLTYKQIQSWFIEKRRKERNSNNCGFSVPSRNSVPQSSHKKHKKGLVVKTKMISKRKKAYRFVQDIFSADYILKTLFRKDGPPLGTEFDSLPSRNDTETSHPCCGENPKSIKRRKVSNHGISSINGKDAPAKKHGMGKGLMTLWRATNPNAGDYPGSIDFANEGPSVPSISRSSRPQVRKPVNQKIITGRLRNKIQEKKKKMMRNSIRSKEVEFLKEGRQLPYKEKCELSLGGQDYQENFHQISMLMDDEELELRAVPNPPGCSGHFTYSARLDCSLCKGQLAKFPPNSVMMKLPFSVQPWESSPESVKKLFKAFHFIYTYSLEIDACHFTLDEFAQAFHDKDLLLLGRINVALLKLLLSDIEVELYDRSSPQRIGSSSYLDLLHFVENQEEDLEFWRRSLNPLTWTEILCQVLVAAGFGLKQSTTRRETLDKEMYLMMTYGLHPGTLKGELFKILLPQGNSGLKVSDLAKSLPIIDLKLAITTKEVECIISSMLSSDITLFEKISPTTYRLRSSAITKNAEECLSDSEDGGAVDDDLNECGKNDSDADSGLEARDSSIRKVKNSNLHKNKNSALTVSTEIDESHPGETWLVGLMEGEYSDLSIEEKLDAMMALIDLLRDGCSIRMEDTPVTSVDTVNNINRAASGGKIKRSSTKHQSLQVPSRGQFGQIQGVKEGYAHWKSHALDSSASISKFRDRGKEAETFMGVHPLQSVFLGSDRRFNRYWLFLGPCNGNDPGHGRIYFESSEDCHWEVIDTEEGLRALLSVLDDRGKREALLIESLEKCQASLYETMSSRKINNIQSRPLIHPDQFCPNVLREDSCSPISDVENILATSEVSSDTLPLAGAIALEVGNRAEEKKQKWWRLQAFDKWIWNSFYLDLNSVKNIKRSYYDSLTRCECCHELFWRDEKHCRVCHTTFEIDFDQEERYAVHSATCRDSEGTEMFRKVLCSQIQALKAATYAIESAMPEDSLVGAWTKSAHKLWVKRLRRTSSLQELLQVIADFIGAINDDWICETAPLPHSQNGKDIIGCFASLPRTTSALALWLVKLDTFISPYLASTSQGRTRFDSDYENWKVKLLVLLNIEKSRLNQLSEDIKVGSGPTPPVGFQVIKGLDEGILTMEAGGKRRIYIPGPLAFPKGLNSAPGRPRVAPNSPVVFDVSLEYIPGLELDLED